MRINVTSIKKHTDIHLECITNEKEKEIIKKKKKVRVKRCENIIKQTFVDISV